jgi:NAD(P)-dependent dehydrogenase (short-subunit alcohol dehydrogenase family)
MGILDGKVAIVTGAGQGVGRGISLALAKAGAAVALAGRTRAKLTAVAEEIGALGGKAKPIICDVTRADDITATVEEASRTFGALHILVNNAYDGVLGPLATMDDANFEKGFAAGPFATFRFMKACYPHFTAAGEGSIINLATSAAVRWDMANYGAYGAAKEAIRVLTRAAAAEWGPEHIRVNTICPLANSPALAGWAKARPQEAEAFFQTVPLRRIGDCEEDIGQVAVFLCSPQAAYLSGATIPLDGGQARFG